jgi:glutathione S-transferase
VAPATEPAAPTLLSLRYSPWSERARWALDHHGLAYHLLEHDPFFGEWRLRRLTGKQVRPATVPLLITERELLRDSYDIALYADRHGKKSPLVPAELEPEIRALNELVNRTLTMVRGLVTAAVLDSSAALDETLPNFVPRSLRPPLRPFSRFATRWFAQKYAIDLADRETPLCVLADTLSSFRERYAGKAYLFGRFTYADVVFCSLLQGVSPVDDRFIPLEPAWRKAWTRDDLARDFTDLIALRDRLYAAHRMSRRSPS